MLESWVEQYLLKYLGEHILWVDKQNLSVATWSGKVHLRCVQLKPQAVELLNLPFQLRSGSIADLEVQVPWNRIGSRPVKVELRGLFLVLGPKPFGDWSEEEERRRVQLHRRKKMAQAELLSDLKQGLNEQGQAGSSGFMSRVLTRVADNLELQVNDVHLRFEDNAPGGGGPPFCAGLLLESLQMKAAGADWVPTFIDRSRERSQQLFKLLTFEHLRAYYLPPRSPQQHLSVVTWQEEGAKGDELVSLPLGDEEGAEQRRGEHYSEERMRQDILEPVSGQLQLTQSLKLADTSTPRFAVSCQLQRIKVQVSRSSYSGLSGLMALVSEYFAFQEVVRHRIEVYWPHRPNLEVLGNARLWWKYAARCILLRSSGHDGGHISSFASLLSPGNLLRLRTHLEYTTLLRKSKLGQLAAEEKSRMEELETSGVQLSDLLRWRSTTLETLQLEQEQFIPRGSSASSLTPGSEQKRGWGFWFNQGARPPSASNQTESCVLEGQQPVERSSSSLEDEGLAEDVLLVGVDGYLYQRNGSPVTSRKASDADAELRRLNGDLEPSTAGQHLLLATKTPRYKAFAALPSVGSWLQTRLPGEAITPLVTSPLETIAADEEPQWRRVVQELETDADPAAKVPEPEHLPVQDGLGVNETPQPPSRKAGAPYFLKPSVASWLQVRSCTPPSRKPSDGTWEQPGSSMHTAEREATPKVNFKFLPSVGTWLRPNLAAQAASMSAAKMVIQTTSWRSWQLWLFGTGSRQKALAPAPSPPEVTSAASGKQASEKGRWSWFRSKEEDAVPPPEEPAEPNPEEPEMESEEEKLAEEKFQRQETGRSGGWAPWRWFRSPETSEPQEAAGEKPASPDKSPAAVEPLQVSVEECLPEAPAEKESPTQSRTLQDVADVTGLEGTTPRSAEQGQQPAAEKVVESPPFHLLLNFPEVVVELMHHSLSRTAGTAVGVQLLFQGGGEELTTRVSAADLSLVACRKEADDISETATQLLYVRPSQQERCPDALAVEYTSGGDASPEQPWISVTGEQPVLFFQRELFAEVTSLLSNQKAGHRGEQPARRGFDRWRRRAKALLYSRGRPRVSLQLTAPALLLPTLSTAARRAAVKPRDWVLALGAQELSATSQQIAGPAPREAGQRSRSDRWDVVLDSFSILHHESHEAFLARKDARETLLEDYSSTVVCLLHKQEGAPQSTPVGILGFEEPRQLASSMQIDAVSSSAAGNGEPPPLVLSLSHCAYSSLVASILLLVGGAAKEEQAEQEEAHESFASGAPFRAQDSESWLSDTESPAKRDASTPGPGARFHSSFSWDSADDTLRQASMGTTSELGFCSPIGFSRAAMRSRHFSGFSCPSSPGGVPMSPPPSRVSAKLSLGLISVRMQCLQGRSDSVEIRGSGPTLSYNSSGNESHADLSFALLELIQHVGGASEDRFVKAEPGLGSPSLCLSITPASELAPDGPSAVGVSVHLGQLGGLFLPGALRSLIGFCRSRDKRRSSNDPPPALESSSDPPLEIRCTWEQGVLGWVEEKSGVHFAESRMAASTVVLELYTQTVSFRCWLPEFELQDLSSCHRPMILGSRWSGKKSTVEVSSQTFLGAGSADFRGYQTYVTVSFGPSELMYLGQKFMRCWNWLFKAFVPAVTASQWQRAGEKREEELRAAESVKNGSDDGSASFVSCEGDTPATGLPPRDFVALHTELSEIGEDGSPAEEISFLKLSETGALPGQASVEKAWQEAVRAFRAALEQGAQAPGGLQSLTRFEVAIESALVILPLSPSGAADQHGLCLEATNLLVQNAPHCLESKAHEDALVPVDVMVVTAQDVCLRTDAACTLLGPVDLSMGIRLSLIEIWPALPTLVTWVLPKTRLFLTSRDLALLRAVFSRNVVGYDPDVVVPADAPDAEVAGGEVSDMPAAIDTPVWLRCAFDLQGFELNMLKDDVDDQQEAARGGADSRMAVISGSSFRISVGKHTGPRVKVGFGLRAARILDMGLPAAVRHVFAPASGRTGVDEILQGEYISDGSQGVKFTLKSSPSNVVVELPFFKSLWRFLFPPRPHFPEQVCPEQPPPAQQSGQSGAMAIAITLEQTTFRLVEVVEDPESPALLVEATLAYGYESCSGASATDLGLNDASIHVLDPRSKLQSPTDMDEAGPSCRPLTEHTTFLRLKSDSSLRDDCELGALFLRLSPGDSELCLRCLRSLTAEPRRGQETTSEGESPAEQGAEQQNQQRKRFLNCESLRFIVMGESIPFLDVRASKCAWQYVQGGAGDSPSGKVEDGVRQKVDAAVNLQFFNPVVGAWEPLLEGAPAPTWGDPTAHNTCRLRLFLSRQRCTPSGQPEATKRLTEESSSRAGSASPSSPPTPADKTHLQLHCEDHLLLNLSDVFCRTSLAQCQVWLDLVARAQDPALAEKQASAQKQRRSQFAPLSIRNSTGMEARVRLPGKLEKLDGGGQLVRVANNSELELRKAVAALGGKRRVGLQLATASGEPAFDEVHAVPLDSVGHYAFALQAPRPHGGLLQEPEAPRFGMMRRSSSLASLSRPKHQDGSAVRASSAARSSSMKRPPLPWPYLVCRVEAVEDRRVLRLEAPVVLVNHLDLDLALSVSGSVEEGGSSVELRRGGTTVVPLALCSSPLLRLRMQPRMNVAEGGQSGFGWSEELQFNLGAETCISCVAPSSEAAEVFVCSVGCSVGKSLQVVDQANHIAFQYQISMYPTVLVMSTLPVPVHVQFTASLPHASEGEEKVWRECVQPGGCRHVHQVTATQIRCLRLSLYSEGETWSEPATILEQEAPMRVPTDAAGQKNALLRLLRRPGAGGCVELVVHTPAWILDHVASSGLQFFAQRAPTERAAASRHRHDGVGEASALPVTATGQPLSGDDQSCHSRVLLLDRDAAVVLLRMEDATSSREISLGALGGEAVAVEAPVRQGLPSRRLDLGVRLVDLQPHGLNTRVLHVAPRYIVANATDHPLQLRQAGHRGTMPEMMSLGAHRRQQMHWTASHLPHLLQVRVAEAGWRWSGRLLIDNVGEYVFQGCSDSPTPLFENLRLEVRLDEATIFVIFRRDDPRLAAYRIFNDSQVSLFIRQQDSDVPSMEVCPGVTVPFAWHEPSLAKRIEIRGSRTAQHFLKLDFEQPQAGNSGTFRSSREKPCTDLQGPLLHRVERRGTTLLLTLRSGGPQQLPRMSVEQGPQQGPQQLPRMSVELRLAGVGISIVAPVSRALRGGRGMQRGSMALRSELLFASARQLRLLYQKSHGSEDQEDLELLLQDLQLDNQLEDALQPVVLARGTVGHRRIREVIAHAAAGSSAVSSSMASAGSGKPLLHLRVRCCREEEVVYFEHVEILLRGIDVHLDTGFLLNLGDLWQRLLGSSLEQGGDEASSSSALLTSTPFWPIKGIRHPQEEVEMTREGRKLHFKRLVLHQASLRLTFSGGGGLRGRRGEGSSGNADFWYRSAARVAAVSSVDSSLLRLDALMINDTTMNVPSFQAALQNHYKGQCVHQLAGVVVSLELLGNPRGLLRNFCTGCIDICCEPYHGAMRSPEDMLEGMILGGGSCVQNACFGAANSVSKAAGAAMHCCLLCLNEDRAPVPRPPRSLCDGLRLGLWSCGSTTRDGCQSLALAPRRGFERSGARGALLASAGGLAGCLVQGLVGCCDLTRLCAEGLGNSAMGTRERLRARQPRMLYGPGRVMRPYALQDARLKDLLGSVDARLGTLALVDCVWDPGGTCVAVVSDGLFVCVSKSQRRVLIHESLWDCSEEIQQLAQSAPLQEACRRWIYAKLNSCVAGATMHHAVQLLSSVMSS